MKNIGDSRKQLLTKELLPWGTLASGIYSSEAGKQKCRLFVSRAKQMAASVCLIIKQFEVYHTHAHSTQFLFSSSHHPRLLAIIQKRLPCNGVNVNAKCVAWNQIQPQSCQLSSNCPWRSSHVSGSTAYKCIPHKSPSERYKVPTSC